MPDANMLREQVLGGEYSSTHSPQSPNPSVIVGANSLDQSSQYPAPHVTIETVEGKSRLTYILLGVILGLFLPGIHNFYAGYIGKGFLQLFLPAVSCGILGIPIYIWILVEAFSVKEDNQGNPMI